MTLTHRFAACFLLFAAVVTAGCAATRGSADERRQAILEMQRETLAELYEKKPDVRSQINQAAGFAVFSNANINVVLASFGGGYGVLTDNQDGARSYMKMGEVGVGLGAGVKDFRIVMVFHDRNALERFEEIGVTVGAQADAAAKASEQGAAIGGEAVADNVTVYQLTQTGLALQATIKGTKFWMDSELN